MLFYHNDRTPEGWNCKQITQGANAIGGFSDMIQNRGPPPLEDNVVALPRGTEA